MGDTLTAAIAGTERGEVWEHSIAGGLWLTQDHTGITGVTPFPLTGWRRREPELRCAMSGCTGRPCVYQGAQASWCVRCGTCGLLLQRGYPTEAEAREAWSRIGVRWRKPEEWQEGDGYALWLDRDGYFCMQSRRPGYAEIVAVVSARDLPRPPWAKEE